ncbi:MAG TPA: tail fiber protein [Mucilaginibacter sp.]
MDGTIGEIRAFAGTFAPLNWQLCQGQTLSISAYTTLFAIIGTIYGGNGQTTFQLPNLQSRVVIGTGQGIGLPNYDAGQTLGEEGHTLNINEMPSHNHTVTSQTDNTPSSATFTLNGINATGGKPDPQNNVLAQDSGGKTIYAPSGLTISPMNAGSVTLNSFTSSVPTVTVNMAGSSLPHSNIQPVCAINYIICVQGIFPSRD